MPIPDRTIEFQQKLRALLIEYGFDLEVNTGYYGEIEGIDFCIDGKRVVEATTSGRWDFDGNGLKSLDQIRAHPSPL